MPTDAGPFMKVSHRQIKFGAIVMSPFCLHFAVRREQRLLADKQERYMRKYLSVLTVIVTLCLGVIGSAIAAHPAFADPDGCGGAGGQSCN